MKPFTFMGRTVVLVQVKPNNDPDNPCCSQCTFAKECNVDGPPVQDLPYHQQCLSMDKGVYKEIK